MLKFSAFSGKVW